MKKGHTQKLIGHCGVDSGQLLICDPGYIDSQWEKEEFKDIRKYKHKTTGDVLQYRVDFENFMSPIPKYDFKNMNDLLESGEWDEIKDMSYEHNFSYNACAQLTLSDERAGQLKYKHGHDGVGVVLSTIIGDGYYPVIAEYDEDGYLMHIKIKILED